MSNANMDSRHVTELELLQLADGELKARETEVVRRHLSSCWQCRTSLEEIETTIGECVHYRKTLFDHYFPSPSAPWCDIRQQMMKADATLGSASFFERTWDKMKQFAARPRIWAPVVAASLAMAVVVYQFQNTPTVSAAELIQKAVVAAQAQPAKARKIQIKTRSRSYTRAAVLTNAQVVAEMAAIQQTFLNANYNWDEPLSAKSYQNWREHLPQKTEDVTTTGDSYIVKTATNNGDLAEVSLRLRSTDFEALESTLEFRNQERIEIRQVLDEGLLVTQSGLPLPNSTRSTTVGSQFGTPPPGTAVVKSLTPASELKVYAALRRLGADLGEPIEISRRGSQVLVTGIGVSPQRQQQIEAELASQPGVVVEFRNPDTASPIDETAAATRAQTSSALTVLQQDIANYLGGRAKFEAYGDQMLVLSDNLLSRIHALRRLAEKFPSEAEAQFGAADLQTLRQLRIEHTQALVQTADELNAKLAPVLTAAGASSASLPPANLPSNWQAASDVLLRQARSLEAQLGVLAGGANGDSVTAASLNTALLQLRSQIASYQILIIPPQ